VENDILANKPVIINAALTGKNDILANKPVIINAALTGMVPTKEDTPHVPITIEEIAVRPRNLPAADWHGPQPLSGDHNLRQLQRPD